MPQDIIFLTETTELVPAQLLDIKQTYAQGNLTGLKLLIAVDYEVYKSIEKNGFFHLITGTYPEKATFLRDKKVEIGLKADPLLLRTLGELNDEARTVALITSDDAAAAVIRREINWYMQSAAQEVELPEDLEEAGTVQEGFETAFADDDEEFEGNDMTEMLEEMLDEFKDIENILTRYNIPFVRKENEFSGEIIYQENKWSYFIYEAGRVFVMCSAYLFFFDEDRYDAVCREIASINGELTVGNFDFDLTDGVLLFRTSIDIGEDYLIPELFERMLVGNIATAGKYYGRLYQLYQKKM